MIVWQYQMKFILLNLFSNPSFLEFCLDPSTKVTVEQFRVFCINGLENNQTRFSTGILID